MRERLLKIVPAGRKVWAAGGVWERFFILAPVIWVGYALGLLLVIIVDPRLYTDPQLPYEFYMVMGLMFTSGFLLDPWRFPLILSSRVLRVVAELPDFGGDFLRNEAVWSNAIQYLETSGKGGRWTQGNALSLSYFVGYLGWGAFALRFPDLTRISDGLTNLIVFMSIHVGSVALMLWLYHRALHRMASDAARKGLPFLDLKSV